jgi:hypothetical protein
LAYAYVPGGGQVTTISRKTSYVGIHLEKGSEFKEYIHYEILSTKSWI